MTPKPFPTPWRWVDLGLPSGILWLDRNVGANSPEETGQYFTWIDASGWADPPTSLPYLEDAATYYYGNKFRMPSEAEFRELIANTNMSRESNGFRFTSIANGESILIPKSGALEAEGLKLATTMRLWSNTPTDNTHLYSMFNEGDTINVRINNFTVRALPVRPVYNR